MDLVTRLTVQTMGIIMSDREQQPTTSFCQVLVRLKCRLIRLEWILGLDSWTQVIGHPETKSCIGRSQHLTYSPEIRALRLVYCCTQLKEIRLRFLSMKARSQVTVRSPTSCKTTLLETMFIGDRFRWDLRYSTTTAFLA
jgi:hypothetical protein